MRSRSPCLLMLAALLIAAPSAVVGSRETHAAEVSVIDGDTLQVGDRLIQLYGIDAPELGQLCNANGTWRRCGVDAALALGKLLAMAADSLHCAPWSGGDEPTDGTGATVAVCETGTEDLGRVMLKGGHVVAVPGAFPDYPDTEQQAREAGLGLWHSAFVMPWDWRGGERLPDEPTECDVKAVIDDEGERLYYVPTDPDFEEIAVNPQQGRLFCSDEAARLDGWSRPSPAVATN